MRNRKTHEQFLKDLFNKNENAENIEILEKYKGSQVKIKCRCKICNCEWEVTPSGLLQNTGCPDCSLKHKRTTHQQFVDKMTCISPTIKICSEYISRNSRIDCECIVCGNKWNAKAGNLLNGRGCKQCANKHLSTIKKKTHEEFVEKLRNKNIYFESFEILDKYVNDDTKLRCRCNKCNSIWEVTPRSLNQGHSCPNCLKPKGEERIEHYLKELHIDYESQKRFIDLRGTGNKLLSYDYYIPCNNTLIEYQGKQHYLPLEFFGGENQLIIQQEHDRRKREYAFSNGYEFIEIPYWEYDNIENILCNKMKEVI